MNLLLVFLDGVGLGDDDPERNPFARYRRPTIESLLQPSPGGPAPPPTTQSRTFASIDANLGVEGLPQSGTGQATLFTGINCAKIVGRHYGPFPHSSTRAALAEHNIFKRVNGVAGASSAFANAYPPRFFEVMSARDRWTVTTRCCLDAGVHIRTLDDLRNRTALAADITGERLMAAGFDASPVSEEDAAHALLRLSSRHRLTVFEYFLTDKVGHRQDFGEARVVIDSLEAFFRSLLAGLDGRTTSLIVTSDHGNMEDLSHRTHTRNPVPFVALGEAAPHFRGVRSLIDVTPAILDALGGSSS